MNYNHINKAFGNWDTPEGKLVKNKDHYDRLMKENNMISYEESVDREKNKKQKEYVPSQKAKDILKAAKSGMDKKGNITLSDNTIEAMKSIGAYQKVPDYMKVPRNLIVVSGGFNLSKEQKEVCKEGEYALGFTI